MKQNVIPLASKTQVCIAITTDFQYMAKEHCSMKNNGPIIPCALMSGLKF